jgi:hypothetical protein
MVLSLQLSPQKRTQGIFDRQHVRSRAVLGQRPKPVTQPAVSNRSKRSLFDHLVGAGEQHRRNGEAERFGGLQIWVRLIPSRLLDRDIARISTFNDLGGDARPDRCKL